MGRKNKQRNKSSSRQRNNSASNHRERRSSSASTDSRRSSFAKQDQKKSRVIEQENDLFPNCYRLNRALSDDGGSSKVSGLSKLASLTSGKNSGDAHSSHPQEPKGLHNRGNWCYFNSVLQVLSHTHALFDQMNYIHQDGSEWIPWSRRDLLYLECDQGESDESEELCNGNNRLVVSLPPANVITREFVTFLKKMRGSKNEYYMQEKLLKLLGEQISRFRGGTQEDAHELLRALLHELKEDLIRRHRLGLLFAFDYSEEDVENESISDDAKACLGNYGRSTDFTIIDSLFGGLVIASTVCEECANVSQIIEQFLDLSLSFGPGIKGESETQKDLAEVAAKLKRLNLQQLPDEPANKEKKVDLVTLTMTPLKPQTLTNGKVKEDSSDLLGCFYKYFAPDHLTGVNQLRCENCEKLSKNPKVKQYKDGIRQLLIALPPPILTVHLKRFRSDGGRCFRKIDRAVSFPEILNLSPFTSQIYPYIARLSGLKQSDLHPDGIVYSLYGVVEHIGMSLSGGHYVAYVRVPASWRAETVKKFMPLKPFIAKVKQVIDFIAETENETSYSNKKPAKSNDTAAELKGDKWYYISDETVKPISLNSVLNKQAYLLFYERIK